MEKFKKTFQNQAMRTHGLILGRFWSLRINHNSDYCGDFGPGGLRATPEVAFVMRSWPLLISSFSLSFSSLSLIDPGGLRAPPKVAFVMRS